MSFFFVDSLKCAYPSDIALGLDQMNVFLRSSVFPNFPVAIRTPTLFPALRYAGGVLDHSTAVTDCGRCSESKYLFWNLSAHDD